MATETVEEGGVEYRRQGQGVQGTGPAAVAGEHKAQGSPRPSSPPSPLPGLLSRHASQLERQVHTPGLSPAEHPGHLVGCSRSPVARGDAASSQDLVRSRRAYLGLLCAHAPPPSSPTPHNSGASALGTGAEDAGL